MNTQEANATYSAPKESSRRRPLLFPTESDRCPTSLVHRVYHAHLQLVIFQVLAIELFPHPVILQQLRKRRRLQAHMKMHKVLGRPGVLKTCDGHLLLSPGSRCRSVHRLEERKTSAHLVLACAILKSMDRFNTLGVCDVSRQSNGVALRCVLCWQRSGT